MKPSPSRAALCIAALLMGAATMTCAQENERPLDARVDVEAFRSMVADLNRFGFVTKPVNPAAIIDNSFLPR